MTSPWPRFQSLPDDGALWHLTWLGPFFSEANMPSQRSVLAAVSRLRGSVKRSPSKVIQGGVLSAEQFSTQRLVSFAVGDLPALTLGTLYRHGRPVSRAKSLLTETTFTLNFDKQQVFRLNEVPAGQAAPVFSPEALLLTGAWPPLASSACTALTVDDDPYGVVFPLPETLRWCYGSSSRMLQAVLSGDLAPAVDRVRHDARLHDGQYDIQLPAGFMEQDAPTLAWLASDPGAAERALFVDRSVMVNAGQASAFPALSAPSAWLPYQGQHTVQVLGRRITAPGAPPRFLVHRILNTSFLLPFRVSVARGQADSAQPGPEGGGTRNRKTPPADPRKSELTSNREPRRGGNPARLPALTSQFSGQPLAHHPVPALPSPARTLLNTRTPTGEFSTGTGQDASSRARRATLVHRGPRETPNRRSDEWDTLRRVMALLTAGGVQVSELAVNNPGGQESHFPDWTLSSGEAVACLIAQLKHQDAFAYLFEKERTGSEYGPLLIAWFSGQLEASEDELDTLLSLRAGSRTWPREYGDWTLIHLPHAFGSDESYAAGIRSRLNWPEQSVRKPTDLS